MSRAVVPPRATHHPARQKIVVGPDISYEARKRSVLASDHREHQREGRRGQLIGTNPPDDEDRNGLDRILKNIGEYYWWLIRSGSDFTLVFSVINDLPGTESTSNATNSGPTLAGVGSCRPGTTVSFSATAVVSFSCRGEEHRAGVSASRGRRSSKGECMVES